MLGIVIVFVLIVIGACTVFGLFGDKIEALLQRRELARRLADPAVNVTPIRRKLSE